MNSRGLTSINPGIWLVRPLVGKPISSFTFCHVQIAATPAFALGTWADRPAKPRAALPTIRYALAENEKTYWFAH